MSWSDDTRCLFCDGKLPLFRKLAQGQFCSKVHQEAYWKEQDQLAVQVLHRTHDALQAYKPAVPIESILGPVAAPPPSAPPSVPPVFVDTVPELQGLTRQPGLDQPISPPAFGIIAADPVEYEVHRRATAPSNPLANPVSQLDRLAALVELHQAHPIAPVPVPAALEILDAQLILSSPEWLPGGTPDLAFGKLVALAGITPGEASDTSSDTSGTPQALEFSIRPVRELVHTLAPIGDVIERMEHDAFPLGETQFALREPQSASGFVPVLAAVDIVAFPDAVPDYPRWSEATSLPVALGAAEKLLVLAETIAARDTRLALDRTVMALEPRTPHAVMDSVRMAPVAGDPMADLLSHVGLAPLTGLPVFAALGSVEDPANRPVSYQAFAPECAMRLPDSVNRRVGSAFLEIRSQATQVFRLEVADKMSPRPQLRLRPGFSAAPLEGQPFLPPSKLQPVAPKQHFTAPLGTHIADARPEQRRMAAGVANFWNHAPRDLKMLLFAVPLALGLAFHPSLPKVSVQAPQADTKAVTQGFQQVLDTQWASLRKSMADRAAVGLDENFRTGLDNWMSHSGSTAEWSFDQAGFVQPGRVALYQPSLGLTDYEFQFLGAIDKGALSWVARAVDFQNYYVVKLVVVKNGPVPEMGITRYAVIDGKPMDRVDTPVTFSARTDSLYRVSMVMEGDHYSLVIQGQMIDSWNEPRLKRGGVGFFTNRGEQSRIGWVQITHQYDMLGRLFAYLAP